MIKLVETNDDWTMVQRLQAIMFPGNFDTQYYKRWRQNPNFRGMLMIDDDGQPRACGTFVVEACTVLHSIGVLAVHRRCGFGMQLWEAIRAYAIANGATECELHVSVSNHAAIAFYQRIGFGIVETIHDYYRSRALRGDALRMRRTL